MAEIFIIPNSHGGWDVRLTDQQSLISRHDTEADAIEHGRVLLMRRAGGRLVLVDGDGRIRTTMLIETGGSRPREGGHLDDELIDRFVSESPHRPGKADAWLGEWGIPVWAIIGQYQAGAGDAAQIAADYDIPRHAVDAAFAFYRQHSAVIDARIAASATAVS